MRGVGGDGRWTGGVLGGEGDRILRGWIAIEMEGDRGGLHKKKFVEPGSRTQDLLV